MEDIIIIGIIIVSIVVNIVKNYKKETEKNSKRVIGEQTPAPNNPIPSTEIPETIQDFHEWLDTDISPEEIYVENKVQHEVKPSVVTNSEAYDMDINDSIKTPIEHNYSLTAEEVEEENRRDNFVFKTKDDVKKAVLYSIILEKKF